MLQNTTKRVALGARGRGAIFSSPKCGVPVPKGRLARSPEEVESVINEIGEGGVLKSQILAGGRGKGKFDNGFSGGIHVARSAQEGKYLAGQMLNHYLVTKQTTSQGLLVDKLYVAETLDIKKELYVAITVDRERFCPAIIISQEGGVDIELIAASNPDKLKKIWFSYSKGITDEVMQEVQSKIGFSDVEAEQMRTVLSGLFKVFCDKDATLIEINPLVQTRGKAGKESQFVCADAKLSFDNAAKSRQKELFDLRDYSQEIFEEAEAEKHGLLYVRLDGDIGNVVNGAGLAMATNDAISSYGGQSANFLDAGGQATKETMQKAFEIILNDPRVTTILVNIYGGIIRCDMIAESIIGAAAALDMSNVPIVVRLQGTNAAAGQRMIADSGLGLYAEDEFGNAAKKAVELARNAQALKSNSQKSEQEVQFMESTA